MIVGTGMIAQKFIKYSNDNRVIIFASGVSNSTETRQLEFEREKRLLVKTVNAHPNKLFIYFSSCYIENNFIHQNYYNHKEEMERIIQSSSVEYIIFRLPQVVGVTSNKYTLFNFLLDCVMNGTRFDIWMRAKRNLIDIDDIYQIVNYIIRNKMFNNRVLNVASPCNYSILPLVRKLEVYLGKDAKFNSVDKGDTMDIDVSDILNILDILKINFDENYLEKIINKYAPKQNIEMSRNLR